MNKMKKFNNIIIERLPDYDITLNQTTTLSSIFSNELTAALIQWKVNYSKEDYTLIRINKYTVDYADLCISINVLNSLIPTRDYVLSLLRETLNNLRLQNQLTLIDLSSCSTNILITLRPLVAHSKCPLCSLYYDAKLLKEVSLATPEFFNSPKICPNCSDKIVEEVDKAINERE